MPYEPRDVRSKLPGGVASVPSRFSGAEYLKLYEEQPQEEDTDFRTWHVRAQNFVLSYSEVHGTMFFEGADTEEQVVLLIDREIQTHVAVDGDLSAFHGSAMLVLPPGKCRVECSGRGRLVRLVRANATAPTARCINAQAYVQRHANVAEFHSWPEPVKGYQCRAYDLSVPPLENPAFRLFRCTTFMVNYMDPVTGPRDLHKLSPHVHDDFEQCSLVLSGEYVHHIRWPWGTDRSEWRADEHEVCRAPSVAIIPAGSIHTSEAVSSGLNHLIDIFSPPRLDFSAMQGWVFNADDYPAPS